MEDGIKELLQANYDLNKENNKLLKKVRGVQKRAQTAKVIYWLFILALAFGAYYYIQPVVKKISGFLPALSGIENSLQNLPDLNNLEGLLKK